MFERPAYQTISDDKVRRILLAPRAVLNKDLAAELGVSESAVNRYRNKASKRALRIARELGLIGIPEIKPTPMPRDNAAYVVRGKR